MLAPPVAISPARTVGTVARAVTNAAILASERGRVSGGAPYVGCFHSLALTRACRTSPVQITALTGIAAIGRAGPQPGIAGASAGSNHADHDLRV